MINRQYLIYALTVLLPLLVVVAVTPLIKKIAGHVGALDIPNERKVHREPTPRLGGLGIFIGLLVGYILFGTVSVQMNSILIAGFIILMTGIIDDIKPINPLQKLIGEIASAVVIVFYGKLLIDCISVFGLNINFGLFAYPITLLFIVAIMNVINLIDGLDGLAVGTCSIFFTSVIVICFLTNRIYNLDFTLALIMLGSCLGFLYHNFYPATIFAGDSGSLFLGLMISVISLLGFKTTIITSVFVPIGILAVPILDTLFAIIRRLLHHKHIYDADKDHLHHQLLRLNFSHRNTVLIIYGIEILFSLASILYTIKGDKSIFYGRILFIILFIITVLFVYKTNIVRDKKIKKK